MSDTETLQRIRYPETDGKPMAETDLHRRIMMALIHALEEFFRNDPQVYVAGNLLMYYEEGVPSSCCAPDVFMVRGVSKGDRRTYKLWEEGTTPDFVIEVTSRSTRLEDLGTKKVLYAEMGVEEYFLFDPLNEYLSPPLIGFRLEDGDYVRMEPSAGRFHSDVTGLELAVIDGWPRFIDPSTGKPLHTPAEAEEALRETEEENRQLRDELERLKAQLGE
jgi:Uma2 family endonuclease